MTAPGPAPGAPPTVDAPGGYRPPSLVLIFSITVTGILANTLVNAPLPDILAAFGQPDSRAGLVVASATLPGIVIAPIIGLLADRYGRRKVLIPCLVVFGLGGVAAAFTTTFAAFLACRLLQGFGSAGLINLAVVLIADNWQGTERVKIIGWNAAVLTVSVALFPAVGGVLDQIGGWRLSFAPYGLALVTAAVIWRRLAERVAPEPVTLRAQLRDTGAVLRLPVVFAAISWGFLLFALIFGLFLTVLPILLEQRFGLDPGLRGLMLAVPASTSTIAALLLGRMRPRLGTRRLLLLATGLFVVGFFAIGAAASLLMVAAGALAYGFGEGSTIPTIQDLVASRAPDASRGAVVAAWVGAARAGQTLGPLVCGLSIGAFGPSTTYVVGAGVAAAMFVALAVVRVDRLDRPA